MKLTPMSVVSLSTVAFAGFFQIVAAQAATRDFAVPLRERLIQQFPAVVSVLDLRAPASVSTAIDRDGFLSRDFSDTYRIGDSSRHVTLKPRAVQRSAITVEEGRAAYYDAFPGVDVYRTTAGGVRREILLVSGPEADDAFAYEVAGREGIVEIVNSGRGVRFVSSHDRHLELSAPLVIDAAGRPSLDARWVLDRSADNEPITIRLQIDDRSLRYPIAVVYAPEAWTASARQLRPITNGTGSISGTITIDGSGVPLKDAVVYVYDSVGEFVNFALSGSNGTYSVADLDTGTYRMLIFSDGYSAELYNNIPCADFACDIPTGTGISVTDGANTPNINAALASTSVQINGRVTGTAVAPLGDVSIIVYNSSGIPVDSATSDSATGEYHISLSVAGSYYLRTFNVIHEGYIDQLYSAIDCLACSVTTGTAVTLSLGAVANNVDFPLRIGGRIAGAVTEAGGIPLRLRRVIIHNSAGSPVSYATTELNGGYISFHGLASGNYYAVASAAGYVTQVYNGVACSPCNVTTAGTAIAVNAPSTTGSIDFVLANALTRASGRVTDATTGTPLGGIVVIFHNSTGQQVRATTTEYDGGTYSIVLPQSGRYYARTANDAYAGLVNQLYDGIDCSGCPATGGTPIDIVAGVPATNVNFSLGRNPGNITGLIRDAATTTPIPSAFVQVFGSAGDFAASGFSDGTGAYSMFQGLTTGTYFVVAKAPDYTPTLYPTIACGAGCDVTTGTAVQVTRGATTTGIDFGLSNTKSRVAGFVRASGSGTALGGVQVLIHNASNQVLGSAVSDATTGAYEVVLTVAGTFFAVTQNSEHPQYQDQLWDHMPCDACDPSSGTPIVVASGGTAQNINFDLVSIGCPAITLDPATLAAASVGVPYSETITASVTATFAVTAGALPLGLTLSSSGDLSGTPSAGGTYSFTVTATNANSGCAGSADYTLQVNVSSTTTTTTLTVSHTSAVYGTAVTLTATVTPDNAGGTVTFRDGGSVFATSTLTNGTATFSSSAFTAGTHPFTATYDGAGTFTSSTSAVVQVTIEKATPTLIWASPAPITYGTALSSLSQLNAMASVGGNFVYSPAAGAILDAGSHNLSVAFTPNDQTNYNGASAGVTLLVNKANQQIVWSNPAAIVYGTPLTAAQLNATVSVPGPSPAGALTYNPSAGTVLNAATHTLNVSAAATANYNQAQASVTINVGKATPVFSNLSAPTIVFNTSKTTIGGIISAGSLIPPGAIVITLANVSHTAPIQADGSFSAEFRTGEEGGDEALYPLIPGHAITFVFGGSSNFNDATTTSLLIVVYGTTGGSTKSEPANSGSTIPFRIKVVDASGENVSEEDLTVVAYGVQLVSGGPWLPAQPPGNQTTEFKFLKSGGGSYMFNLKTTGLQSGNYVLGYKVLNDPSIHVAPFAIR